MGVLDQPDRDLGRVRRRPAALSELIGWMQDGGAWIARRIEVAEHWLEQRGGERER